MAGEAFVPLPYSLLFSPLTTVRLPTVPSRQQGAGVLHEQADHALLVVGLVATERYKLLSSAYVPSLTFIAGLLLIC